MKKGIIIFSYFLLVVLLTGAVYSASWVHYKYGKSTLTSEIKKVEVDIYHLPKKIKPQPNRVYYKKVKVTTSIRAGNFPRVITELETDTIKSSDGESQIFSDEKE